MKKEFIQICVGIDIAKKDFKACIKGRLEDLYDKIMASRTFQNNHSGFGDFWKWVKKHCDKYNLSLKFVMEATGVYHENLAWFLEQKKEFVAIVLGNQSKAFMKSEGVYSKNDKIDAKNLAQMGLVKRLRKWQPISYHLRQLRSQTRQYARLQKQLTQIKNHLHAVEHSYQPDLFVSKQLKKQIAFIEKQVKDIRQNIEKTVEADPSLKYKVAHLCTIPGIALLSAATVVAETGGFELFSSQKQLASYAGYDVLDNQSGTYTGKSRISKKGNTYIRRILYMPALNAVKKEGVFRDFFQKIYHRTKIKMKAYTAVQRKLLAMMYTLWKKEEDFNPNQRNEKGVGEQHAPLLEIA